MRYIMKIISTEILLLLSIIIPIMSLHGQSEDLNRRFDGLKSELKGDISDSKSELKDDIADLKSELKGDIADLKSELKGIIEQGFRSVNKRIDNLWVFFYWFFGGIGGVLGAFLVSWLKKYFAVRYKEASPRNAYREQKTNPEPSAKRV